MAYGDPTGGPGSPKYTPRTAQGNAFVREYEQEDRLKREDEARALAAGVRGVEFIDYADALKNYESRSDVELLVNRRARENAVTFNEQDFTRQRVQEAHPLQSSTIATTTVVAGDNFTDVSGGPDIDGAGPGTTSPDGKDDAVVAPDRT